MKQRSIKIICPDCGKVIEIDLASAASLMGASTSDAKKKSSAENGRKGGRPKGAKNKAPRTDIGKKRAPRKEAKE